jgi:NTE family protein
VPPPAIGPLSKFGRNKLGVHIHSMSGRLSLCLPKPALALSFLIMLGACAAIAPNPPLSTASLNDGDGPISRGGYRLAALPLKGTAADTLVLLCFSGGGKRSAAFGYGVLKGLRDTPLPSYGQNARLLDAVDVISAVSGGSFPAAYYGLYRDRIFTDFEKDFLDRSIADYVWGSFLLPWHYRWLFDESYGTNDRMAEVYDRLMFHGASYGDLQKHGRPLISIDATDVDHGLVFQFVQDQFDLICSDLSGFPISRAVAASNGFPILFTPITLQSHRSQCGNRMPYWLTRDLGDDPMSRADQLADASRLYLDAEATRYVHLMDGGIADNLAMRGLINIIMVLTADDKMSARIDLSRIRRILVISADGQAANNGASAKQPALSSLSQILTVVSGTQIDSYNFETLTLARQQVEILRDTIAKQRCSIAATENHCDDVQSYLVHLSLAKVADAKTRERLQAIPTGLDVDPADVALLVKAGEQQVRESAELARFLASLESNAAPSLTGH